MALTRVECNGAFCAAGSFSGLGNPFKTGRDRRCHNMRIGERGPAFGKFGIDGQRLFKKRDPLGKSAFHADLLDHRPRLKIERVCLAVVGHLA